MQIHPHTLFHSLVVHRQRLGFTLALFPFLFLDWSQKTCLSSRCKVQQKPQLNRWVDRSMGSGLELVTVQLVGSSRPVQC